MVLLEFSGVKLLERLSLDYECERLSLDCECLLKIPSFIWAQYYWILSSYTNKTLGNGLDWWVWVYITVFFLIWQVSFFLKGVMWLICEFVKFVFFFWLLLFFFTYFTCGREGIWENG